MIIQDKPSTGYLAGTTFSCSHNELLASLYYHQSILGQVPFQDAVQNIQNKLMEKRMNNSWEIQVNSKTKLQQLKVSMESNNTGDITVLNFKPLPEQSPAYVRGKVFTAVSISPSCPAKLKPASQSLPKILIIVLATGGALQKPWARDGKGNVTSNRNVQHRPKLCDTQGKGTQVKVKSLGSGGSRAGKNNI